MSTGSNSLAGAGWYPDPLDGNQERLWDGERWSEQVRPAGSANAPVSPPPPPTSAPPPPPQPQPQPDSPSPLPPSGPTSARTGSREGPPERSRSGWSTGSVVGIGLALMSLLVVGGCVVLVGVIPLIAARSEDPFAEESEVFLEADTIVPVPTTIGGFGPVPTTAEFGVVPTTGEPGEVVVDPVGPSSRFGSPAEVVGIIDGGDVALLEVMVEEPTDVTEALLAEGALQVGPVDGVIVVAVPAMILVQDSSVDPLAARSVFDWAVVGGATGTAYRPAEPGTEAFDCSVLDNDLTAAEDFAVGLEGRGIVCVLMPVVEFEHPETRVALTVGSGVPASWIR